jgi:hypothetical protein
MKPKLSVFAFLILALMTLFALAACGALAATPSASAVSASGENLLLSMATPTLGTSESCPGCGQATLSALQTQEKSDAQAQAAATAEVFRANAQATLNAVGATLSVAQTQEKSNADLLAAQVAATAAIVRANAQATLVSAGETQSAAMTQDAIRQTQVQDSLAVTAGVATQNAIATATQQKVNSLAQSTQTAVANQIATQTQAAVATSQWYTNQERQRAAERQGPLNFLWMWCPPLFIVAIAIVCLLFFWRWMKLRETQQRLDLQLPAPRTGEIIEHQPRPQNELVNRQSQVERPGDHVRRWLEEVNRKLNTNKKDDHDNPGN